jgi:hypothetical protein
MASNENKSNASDSDESKKKFMHMNLIQLMHDSFKSESESKISLVF